jgi:MFS family permease
MHRNIRLMGWHNFFTDFRLFGPFIVIYFAQVSGSWTLAMAVLSVQMVTAAALEIPTGILSDRLGRKKTLLAGSCFSVLAFSLYAVAPSFAILILGGFAEGVARSLFTGNNTALIYDSARETDDEAQYHHLLGRTGTMSQIALAISAVLGGLMAFGSLRIVVAVSIVPQILGVLVALRINEPQVRKFISGDAFAHFKEAFTHLRGHRRLQLLTLAKSIGYGVGEANYTFTAGYFAMLWPLWAIGFLRAAGNGLAAVSFWLSGRMIDRFGHFPLLIFTRIFSFIVNSVALLLGNVLSPIFMTSTSTFFGTVTVANEHLVQQTFTDDQRATLGSIVSLLGSLVYVPAAMVIGWVADVKSPGAAIWLSVFVQISLTPIYIHLFRGDRSRLQS